MMFEGLACSVAQLGNDIPYFYCLSVRMVQYAPYWETEGPACVHACVHVLNVSVRLFIVISQDKPFCILILCLPFLVLRYPFFMKLW